MYAGLALGALRLLLPPPARFYQLLSQVDTHTHTTHTHTAAASCALLPAPLAG
jgi:hypothetical protein